MSEELPNSNEDAPLDRKRPLEEPDSSPSTNSDEDDDRVKNEAGSDDDDEDDDDYEEESAPVKKRSRSEDRNDKYKHNKKSKKKNYFEHEAEESGSDSDGDESNDEDEDEDQYEADDMIVMDGEEDDEDYGEGRKKHKSVEHKRLKKSKHMTVVDDEDLLLLQENRMRDLGRDGSASEINPERIREDDKLYDEVDGGEDQDERGGEGLDGAGGRHYVGDSDSDEMHDFIEDDVGDEDGEDDEETRQEQRRRRKEQERAHMLAGGASREQLEEAEALFGEGFEDALEDDSDDNEGDATDEDAEAKEAKRLQKLRARFERSTLVESFCTDHDDVLRTTDRPERLVDVMAGRVAPDDKERLEEADWIAAKLAKKIYKSLSAEEGAYREAEYSGQPNDLPYRPDLWRMDVADIKAAINDSVVSVLEFFQLEDREVPFVWSYRKDYLYKLMSRDDLWFIHEQDQKWEELVAKKRRLLQEWKLISDAALADTDPTQSAMSAKALAMNVSTKEIALEELTMVLEGAQQELESAQRNLEAVQSGGRGSDKVKDGEAVKDWGSDDEEEELEDEEGGAGTQERLEQAEARLRAAEEDDARERAKAEAALQELQELQAAQQEALRPRICSPGVAKSFLALCPTDRYQAILSHTNEEAEIDDCQTFSALLLKGCQAENNEGDFGAGEGAASKKKLRKGLLDKDQAYLKARKSASLREFVQLFNVAACELGDALRFGSAMKMEPPTPPSSLQDIRDVAAQFVSVDYPTADSVIEGARSLLAAEIAHEPSIRSNARDLFRRIATLCSSPTTHGLDVINPFHELFGVHLISHKPLKEMLNATGSERYLFARLMMAQKEGLVGVSLHTPEISTPIGPQVDLESFLQDIGLTTHFMPSQAHPWDEERKLILQEVVEKHLLPALHTEAKRELMRQSRDAIIQESACNFQRMLSVGPYRPSSVSVFDVLKSCPVRPTHCSVASIFLPTEGRDAIFFAFVDRDGLVRAHDLLPGKISKQKKEKIRDFLKASLPDVVVVNTGAGQVAKSTKDMIENYLVKEVQDLVRAERAAEREHRRGRDLHMYDDYDEEDTLFSPDVLLVKDDVARIFGSSSRAKKMFPEVLPGGASAICLARFVQDPLTEYANMWTSADSVGFFGYESFFLDIHPLKSIVERAKVPLLRALERCLVNSVCDVGVDINMAVSHDHLAGPLAFVAGMGLRKADALRSNIKTVLGFVSSRRELFERKLLGRVVYNNAAGYLRVCENGVSDLQLDPLDDTRIHPECYVQNDYAPKICASALEIDHSAEVYIKTVLLLREHCRRELEKNLETNFSFQDAWMNRGDLLELPDKMKYLELDAFAEEVEESGKGKRFIQFEDIKEELRYPWLDRRLPLADCPDEYEMFSLLTGETDQSVYVGLRVPCSILELKSRSVDIMTGIGLRGFARLQNCSDQHIDDVAEVLQRGASVVGVVIAVIKSQFRVEVSFKESDVSKSEAYWFGNRNTHPQMMEWWQECRLSPKAKEYCSSMMYVSIDPYFQEAEALERYTKHNDEKLKLINTMQQQEELNSAGGQKKRGNNHRAVFHPLFHNMNSKQAENYLMTNADSQVGDVVIRPSSTSKDTLVVTWMYLAGLFKHIEVSEHNKLEDQGGIGQELRISGENEDFSDLDEIFARYIQPMNDLVTHLVDYRCYKEFRPDEQDLGGEVGSKVVYSSLEDWLNAEIIAAPNRIPYCICLHEKGAPGYFQLSWLRNAGHRVYTEYIAIKPDGYRLHGKFFPTPSELINWFKQNANKTQAAPTRKSRFSSAPPQQSQPQVQTQQPQQQQFSQPHYSQQTQYSQQSQYYEQQPPPQYSGPPAQYAVPPPPGQQYQQQYYPPPPPPGGSY